MERLRLRSPETPTLITPPDDFRDESAILEPPVMFQQGHEAPRLRSGQLRAERPKTDLFWTAGAGSWKRSAPVPAADVDRAFRDELERLKSHSLLLRFPADGAARVHYRSSRSVVVQHVAINQYRYVRCPISFVQ